MYLYLQREPSVGEATLSRLCVETDFICDVLEDQVREVVGTTVASWKIHGRTAIPAGLYRLSLEMSGRFGPDTLTVNDVDGFEYIRIHGGNTSANTEGCLLPGTRNSANTVAHSQDALRDLRAIVVPAIKAGEEVWLEIRAAIQYA